MGYSVYYQYVLTYHDIYQLHYENTQVAIDACKKMFFQTEFVVGLLKEADDESIQKLTSDLDKYDNEIKKLEEEAKSLLAKVYEYKDKIRELEKEVL